MLLHYTKNNGVKTLRWYDNTDNEEYFEDIKETIDQKYKGA